MIIKGEVDKTVIQKCDYYICGKHNIVYRHPSD